MARKTNLIVYVDKEQMGKPSELFDAAFAHCVKKGLDMKLRHDFINAYTKAGLDEAALKVIDEWVLVRDIATFPFRKDKPKGDEIEDKGTEREVSVDDQPESEPESGAAFDGGDTLDGQDDTGE
ncbi:MAG: hypothetical protein U9Q82_03290 [Chloroflexota bacterium]|nr:hypothetical protein [Chloroflexota bacterium]